MSGCLMLQSRGVDIKDSFLKFILPYQSFFFFWQVIDDGDIVPGWEGKIVAWVEDDSGQKVLSYQEQMAWHKECHRVY